MASFSRRPCGGRGRPAWGTKQAPRVFARGLPARPRPSVCGWRARSSAVSGPRRPGLLVGATSCFAAGPLGSDVGGPGSDRAGDGLAALNSGPAEAGSLQAEAGQAAGREAAILGDPWHPASGDDHACKQTEERRDPVKTQPEAQGRPEWAGRSSPAAPAGAHLGVRLRDSGLRENTPRQL